MNIVNSQPSLALTGTVEAMCLLAVSPDGNWLAASGTSAGVHVYNVKHLKVSAGFHSSSLGVFWLLLLCVLQY